MLHAYDACLDYKRESLTPYQRDLLEIASSLDEAIFARAAEQFHLPHDAAFDEGRETELWIHNGIRSVLSGHCDRWRYYPQCRLLIIVDKKFGYKVVTAAASNKQLRAYAVAGAEKWTADNVIVAITQPRLSYDERLTLGHYTADDIKAARADIFSILEKIKAPDAPLVAGEEQCRYCKAKLLCPAYKDKFTGIQKLVPSREPAVVERSLAECSDDQLDYVLQAIQFADFVKEQARDEARKRVAAGTLTTWKVGKETEMREVSDAEQALALLTVGGTFTRSEVLSAAKLSIGKFEEKLREKRGDKYTWKEAKDEIGALLAPVITKTTKKASLTRVK